MNKEKVLIEFIKWWTKQDEIEDFTCILFNKDSNMIIEKLGYFSGINTDGIVLSKLSEPARETILSYLKK